MDRYERTYGNNYDADLTTKQIAAAVRKQLRADTKTEDSPLYGWAVKVRYQAFAGGTSIHAYLIAPEDVEAKHTWADSYAGENDPANRCTRCGIQAIKARSDADYRNWWLTDTARAAYEYTVGLLGSYNHDGSDIQTDYFDVNFYGHVSISEHNERMYI